MATNFPASLDSLTNPTSSDSLSSPSHSAQHANVNDAVEALQAKVGADSSAVTSSLDYKVAQLEAISHGKILQVVNDYRSGLSTTSTSLVATNASLTITPSAATSKVLVIASVYQVRNSNANSDVYFAIDRDGTTIGGGDETRFTSAVSNARTSVTFYNLDSPASTSALTYTLQWRVSSGTGTIENAHSIMAIEVGA